MLIDQKRLLELIVYAPETGQFTNKVGRGTKAKAGDEAGHVYKGPRSIEYRFITLKGRCYLAHRLVWLYIFGRWPHSVIDHINGNGLDNRLVNLRECDPSENNENLGLSRANKSGIQGVRFDNQEKKWCAEIAKNGIRTRKFFDEKNMAIECRLRLKREIHIFNPTQRD